MKDYTVFEKSDSDSVAEFHQIRCKFIIIFY